MTLVQLEYYVGLCESKNVSSAAKKLNVTQPALSLALKNLESEYKSVFIRRNAGGKNVITESGLVFYGFAKDVLERIGKMEQAIKASCSK